MRIESISIKSATVAIFLMIGFIAIVLSLVASAYFRESALTAQVNSLSRILEVATQEMQQRLKNHSFDLGMKLAHSKKLTTAFHQSINSGIGDELIGVLDDPFISGFVGFSEINLVKLRVFSPGLDFVAESSEGVQDFGQNLPAYLSYMLANRPQEDRLKGIDALWLSQQGPMHSSVLPLGGLRPVGYLEVVVDPLYNLEGIADITRTPVTIYAMDGEKLASVNQEDENEFLPIEYTLHTSDGLPAYRIVGLENVGLLSEEMTRIRTVSVSGFLAMSIGTLLLALWLFNRFVLSPVSTMTRNMRQMERGVYEQLGSHKALKEFRILTDTFNSMANQVRNRTNDLERLLDLDENAILCFGKEMEIVFYNKSVLTLFGYSDDEMLDLELSDLFGNEVVARVSGLTATDKLHDKVDCRHKSGDLVRCNAIINCLDVMGQSGYAIALNREDPGQRSLNSQSEQRLEVVEQSLSTLLEFARSNPTMVLGLSNIRELSDSISGTGQDKNLIREQAVTVMNLALSCWERVLGKSKIDLAEESGIWPVYIDKSTPTTRTLDKYLSLDNCPKNPRSQRVLGTAEFVLKSVVDQDRDGESSKLQEALERYRNLLSGVKTTGR